MVMAMQNKKVAVAMSGGVDSSVAAALLQQQGYDVFGITMLLSDAGRDYSEGEPPFIQDARRVCEILNIPHYVVDFRSTFQEKVKDYFISEYRQGRTPNPCVRCNQYIKFGILLDKALEMGADYLATGHYLRIVPYHDNLAIERAIDADKDQSYMLYHLPQEVLQKVIFPLGEYNKTKVREMAAAFGLPVATKKESQEICFVPDDDYKKYLIEQSKAQFPPGDIVDTAGNVLGRHLGLPFYTIGQRKGLGIAAATPLY